MSHQPASTVSSTGTQRLPVAPKTEKRGRPRAGSQLKAVVLVQTSTNERTKEIANVTSVSKNGAGFTLSRECSAGTLVILVLPMPEEFRSYDLDTDVYQVVGLIQYCQQATIGETTIYHVGVGFIGKHVPESYKVDPSQSYRICGTSDEGLWAVTEAATTFRKRNASRFNFKLSVAIARVPRRSAEDEEDTVTMNISSTGASVRCRLALKAGDRVKFACEEYGFYAMAVVRGTRKAAGGPTTLHLEFEETRFPVEKVRPPAIGR